MKILAVTLFAILVAHHGSSMSMTKTVPEGATLEYRVKGQVVNSINIQPGTYRISVERISQR